jgi:hypothetical protein
MLTPPRTAVILEACQQEYRACDEAGRNAHLNGKVAAALMEKAKSGGPIHRKVTCPSSASYGWSHGELCIGHFQFAAKSILLQFKIPRSLDCPDANRIGDL